MLESVPTEHTNRFGRYALKRDRVPEPLDRVKVLRMPPRSEGLPVNINDEDKQIEEPPPPAKSGPGCFYADAVRCSYAGAVQCR